MIVKNISQSNHSDLFFSGDSLHLKCPRRYSWNIFAQFERQFVPNVLLNLISGSKLHLQWHWSARCFRKKSCNPLKMMIHSTNDAYIRIADWCHLYMGNNTYSPVFICNIIWCGHDGKKKTDIDCNYVNLQIKEKEFGNRKKNLYDQRRCSSYKFFKSSTNAIGFSVSKEQSSQRNDKHTNGALVTNTNRN